MSGVRVSGPGVRKLTELAAQLEVAPADLRRNMRERLTAEAEPLVRKTKESILTMRAKSQARTFRGEIANTVSSRVRAGGSRVTIEIRADGRMMPPGMTLLPGWTDLARGWGHPVFAHGTNRRKWHWVHQTGKPGWFERPLLESRTNLKAAVQAAIDDTTRKLTG